MIRVRDHSGNKIITATIDAYYMPPKCRQITTMYYLDVNRDRLNCLNDD